MKNILRSTSLATFISIAFITTTTESHGDLLVGSWFSHAVFRVDESNGQISPFVISGSGGLSTPDGLTYGPDGNLYVSSADTSQVLRYNGRTGDFIDVFASENINRAGFLAFGPDQNLYVSNVDGRVTRYNGLTGDFIDVFIQAPQLSFPVGLAWNDGLVYVTDFNPPGNVVRFNESDGSFVDIWSTDPVQPIYPLFDRNEQFLVADFGANQVKEYDENGNVVTTLTSPLMNGPVGLLELDDDSLLVTSWNNGRLLRFDRNTGSVLSSWTGITQPNDVIFFSPIPEPSSGILIGSALIFAMGFHRRRQQM